MSFCVSAAKAATSSSVAAPMTATATARGRQGEQPVRARDQIDAGGDHGRRMDQGADRRWAGHRVRQPGLQRQLRRFADRAAEQQGGGE